jgi:hypothetical protein
MDALLKDRVVMLHGEPVVFTHAERHPTGTWTLHSYDTDETVCVETDPVVAPWRMVHGHLCDCDCCEAAAINEQLSRYDY